MSEDQMSPEESTSEEKVEEESKETAIEDRAPNKSGSGLTVLIIIIVLIILAAIAYLGYRNLKDSSSITNTTATATPTSTLTATPLGTVSINPDQSPARDPELSVLARKYLDWIIAEQKSGEDMVASETYQNLDYLTANFKNGIKSKTEYLVNPLTMGDQPITRYTIDSNYAQQTGEEGQVNCTLYSDTTAWNFVITAIKQNGQWVIDNVGSAE